MKTSRSIWENDVRSVGLIWLDGGIQYAALPGTERVFNPVWNRKPFRQKISVKLELNYQYSRLSGKKQEPVVIWVTVCCDLPEKECEIQIIMVFFFSA